MTRILGIFCPSSSLIAFGLLVSMFSLCALNEEARASCAGLCGGTCSYTTDPDGNVVCPAGAAACTGGLCSGACTCTPNRNNTACECE